MLAVKVVYDNQAGWILAILHIVDYFYDSTHIKHSRPAKHYQYPETSRFSRNSEAITIENPEEMFPR